jgi:hypothetical protein
MVSAAHHPLAGMRLAVEGRRAVRGVACLIVRLPDGTPGTVEVSATGAATADSGRPSGALLSVEGVRRLRRLLSPKARGDGRQRHVGSPLEKRQQLERRTFVRGLQPTGAPRQLALPVEGQNRIDRMWESFSPAAQERILRLLARAIARVLSAEEQR